MGMHPDLTPSLQAGCSSVSPSTLWGHGDRGTRGHGDMETGGHRDTGTRGHGAATLFMDLEQAPHDCAVTALWTVGPALD